MRNAKLNEIIYPSHITQYINICINEGEFEVVPSPIHTEQLDISEIINTINLN